MLIDAFDRGLDPELGECCVTCGETEGLRFSPISEGPERYCPKCYAEVEEHYKRKFEQVTKLSQEETNGLRIAKESVRLSELMARGVPPMEWLINGYLPARGVVMVGGAPGCYKTYLAQYLALCVARGDLFLEGYETTAGTVLYIDEENGELSLMRRFQQLKEGLEISDYPDNIILTVFKDIKLDNKESWKTIQQLIDAYDPALVVCDSVVRFMEGDENSAKDVRQLFETLKMFNADRCFLLLHHTRKNGRGGAGELEALRGSGDFAGMVDQIILLEKKPEKNGFILHIPKSRYVDTSRIKPIYIAARGDGGPDDPFYFEHLGEAYATPDRAEQAIQELREWITENKITEFRAGEAINALKTRRISKNAVYEAIDTAIGQGLLVKLKRGLYEVRKGFFVVEEETIGGLG